MEVNKYQDPEDQEVVNSIIERIKNAPSVGDIKKIIDEVFPGWIVAFLKTYSKDYPNFNTNWKKICIQLGVKQSEIMIVDYIDFSNNDNYKLVRMFCELFTRAGFSVRTKDDFIPCSNCDSAIPTETMYKILKSRAVVVPNTYSNVCKGNCVRKDSVDTNCM